MGDPFARTESDLSGPKKDPNDLQQEESVVRQMTWDRTSFGTLDRPVRAGRLIRGDTRPGLEPAENTQDKKHEPTNGSGGCLINYGIVCIRLEWIKDRVAGYRAAGLPVKQQLGQAALVRR